MLNKSRKIRNNHIDIVVHLEAEEKTKETMKELKKAVRKLNHLLEHQLSYKILLIMKDGNN